MTHSFNTFSHSTCASHTLSKNTNRKNFLSNMICNWSLIHRKYKSVPYPIAAKHCVSGDKSCIRNSQILYLKQPLFLMDCPMHVDAGYVWNCPFCV